MKTLFIIPARGGSKGIPGKNIKPLAGKPLICYAIDVARQLAPDEDICVSTDSAEIVGVVEQHGLKVPFMRPAELAADTSGTYEVLLHALSFYEAQGRSYDCVVLLQPTSPFRTAADVAGAMALYRPEEVDMVVSVVEARTNPYYNCYEESADGFLHISKGSGTLPRRQDAPEAWEYNGAVYVINPRSLRAMPLSRFPRRRKYVMSAESSLDLDTMLDWHLAELILAQRK
jgi:N-acylneuraminate cytidylyltransferase